MRNSNATGLVGKVTSTVQNDRPAALSALIAGASAAGLLAQFLIPWWALIAGVVCGTGFIVYRSRARTNS